MSLRKYSFFDKCCLSLDQIVRALTNNSKTTGASYPAEHLSPISLDEKARKQAAALMRINHTGEICAQALYHGQALTSRSISNQLHLQAAAIEEGDHLLWCKRRLDELNDHTSYLNPLWYIGSFGIGCAAGILGDKWSLGFVAETEQQVSEHLQSHLAILPKEDTRSYQIILKMVEDESKHREDAIQAGANPLPATIKKLMRFSSQIMVKTTYWL